MLGETPEFPSDDPLSQVEWLSMDIGSMTSVRQVLDEFEPTRVYHLAGQASVGASFADPTATWEINATGTLRLLNALKDTDVERLLFASSAEVYGILPEDRQPIAESVLPAPVTPYGISKAAAELVALGMGALAGIEVVISRSFNHIGPGQDQRFLLPSMAAQLDQIWKGRDDRTIRVGNLDVTRDFLDVRDVARAYKLLMDHGAAGEVYNIASGVGHMLLDVVERLVELSGTGAALEADRSRMRSVDIPILIGGAARLQSLGWKQQIELDSTLQDLLEEGRNR